MENRKEFVWFPAEESEWVLCQKLSRTPDGGATLRLGKKEFVVSPEEQRLVLPRPGQVAQNYASLEKDGLGAGQVEDALRNQFCSTNPYSNINMVTLCINPFRPLKIFGETYVEKYSALDPNLPPHIFNASASAYKRSMDKKEHQVLLLLGDGCTGKSMAREHVLSFFDQNAGDGGGEFKQMLAILAPFISAQCRCGRQIWQSTRASLEVELGLAADGFTCRTLASVKMLEIGRLARSMDAGFKTFDALYLAAKDERAKEWLGTRVEFRLLGEEIEIEEYDEEGFAQKSWIEALASFEIDDAVVVRILCGLILLADLRFDGSSGPLRCEPEGGLEAAAKALGVHAGSLWTSLVEGSASPQDAALCADAAVAEVYCRLVDLILQHCNEHFPAEAKAITRRIKVLELPSGSDAPGTHRLLTQLLNEARFARMLRTARGSEVSDELRDESELQAAAARAEALCRGCLGALQSGTLRNWAQAQELSESFALEGDLASISGACGPVEHALSSLESGAALDTVDLMEFLHLLSTSSCKYLRDLGERPREAPHLDESAEASEALLAHLEPHQESTTWLVCCLRPNDAGHPDRVNRNVMLRQTEQLRLADMVHLTDKNSCFLWSLKAFREKYAELVPVLADSTPDEEVCRIIVKSAGGGEGTVGAENVFGGEILERLLEHKLQEKMAGAQHLEGTKSEMKQLMEEKLRMETLQREQQQTERLKELESLRGQHQDQQNKQQQLMQSFSCNGKTRRPCCAVLVPGSKELTARRADQRSGGGYVLAF
ncbi:unnamed protein product [Symbiodinium sp. CCMP2592]|nr:unnamed protein product [Symbiodinium sp. CCMP2592]